MSESSSSVWKFLKKANDDQQFNALQHVLYTLIFVSVLLIDRKPVFRFFFGLLSTVFGFGFFQEPPQPSGTFIKDNAHAQISQSTEMGMLVHSDRPPTSKSHAIFLVYLKGFHIYAHSG